MFHHFFHDSNPDDHILIPFDSDLELLSNYSLFIIIGVIISGLIRASRALFSRREWRLWLKSLGDQLGLHISL